MTADARTAASDRTVRGTSPGGVRWIESGPGDPDAAGVPVVLLHGLTDSAACWPTVLPRLAATRRVLAFDARGHGGTPLPDEPFTVSALAEDVAEALTALDLGPVLVVGHSMGGVTAEQLALAHPGLVAGLVLEDPAWRDGTEADGMPGWLVTEIARVADLSVEQIAAAGRESMPGWSDAEVLGWAESETGLDPRLAAVPHRWAERDWVEALAELRVPVTLLTAGEAHGCVVRPAQVERAVELLGAAPDGLLTHVPLPHVGHNIRREAPAAYLAALDAEVARADRAAGVGSTAGADG
ncbi:MAG TPA: alpha/beta fold hydrolase [Cellulomonas sp.]